MGLEMLEGGTAGLAAGIIFVIVLRKTGLLKRENKLYSALVKLYYLYIPLVLAILCAAWFTVSSARSLTFSLFADLRPEIIDASVKAAETANVKIAKLTGDIDELSIPFIAETVANIFDEAF
jgi:hypothetical protein